MHKHADVLRAIAEGKPVEWKTKGAQNWFSWLGLGLNPIEHAHYDWRVKPEPKPNIVRYWGVSDKTGESNVKALQVWRDGYKFQHIVKLTFDANTGLCIPEVIANKGEPYES